MSSIGIAVNLYTLREAALRDLDATLADVKRAGFDYVQWSGMPDLTADEITRALNTAGLKAIGAHCAVEDLEQNFEGAVAYWERIGVPDLGAGGMMTECRHSHAAWIDGCRRLDAVGALLRERGLRLSYHTHGYEIGRFDGDDKSKLDLLMDMAAPENLALEPDTGWLLAAGGDPAAIIRRYSGRCPLLQLQDCASIGPEPEFTALGAGVLEWDAVFDAGEEAAVEWYIYKQETRRGDPFEDLLRSYEFLAERA